MERSRAQTSVELLVIMAIGLVILSSLVGFASQQLRIVEEQRAVKTAESSLERLVEAANQVYAQGKGATRSVDIIWPEGIQSSYTSIAENLIQVRVFNRTLYAEAIPFLTGSLPTHAGVHPLRVRAFDGYVALGEISLSVNPASVFSPMDRNDSSTTTLTFTNAGGDVNMVFSVDWNHSDMDLNLNKADANVASGSTTALDVNFYSNDVATGSYSGKLWVQGTYSDRTETLLVPLKASIALGSDSDLEAYPSTLIVSTYSTDANSTNFQLCNTGDLSIHSISFTPSTGDAGDWVQGISTIPSLSPFSCEQITLSVKPTDSATGTFSGSLYITDFTGLQSIIVPLQVQVGGMNILFNWDWTNATLSPNAIQDFTLSNLGTIPLQIERVKLRNWITCDTQDSNVTSIEFNDESLHSGVVVDGNWINITDVNLPVLTTWSTNTLTFAGDISDENESFIADVEFSDGTVYTSPTYGIGCPDIYAPSEVTDLVAIHGYDAQSIELRFTYPGDDYNQGSVSSVILKYSTESTLSNETQFGFGIQYPYHGPFDVGGSPGSILIDDLNVGDNYYFALKFVDDNGNTGTLSNNAISRPWNRFEWTSHDFNFNNMPYTSPLVSIGDVNQFYMSNIQIGDGSTHQVGLRIVQDNNESHGWNTVMDFNTTHLTRVRIWYPSNRDIVPTTSPEYDQNRSILIDSNVNLLLNSFGGSVYRYNGSAVSMQSPNDFRVYLVTGLNDFNFTIDQADGGITGGASP